MKNSKLLSYLELSAVSVIWGATFIAAKQALEVTSPIILASTRFVISSLLFLPVVYRNWKKGRSIDRQDVKTIILLGLLGVTFFYIFQFLGLEYTTATNVSLLIALIPAFTLLLSVKMLKERLSIMKVVSMGISLLGAFLVVTNGHFDLSARIDDLIGALFIFSNIICWSLYTVIGKKVLQKYPAEIVTAHIVIWGTGLMMPIAFIWGDLTEIANLGLIHWVAILYLGIFGSFIAYFLWYHALEKVDASKASTFLYFIPLVTIILASVFLKEPVTPYILTGGFMIITGVYFTTKDY